MSEKLGKINDDDFKNYIHSKCGFLRKEVSVGAQFGVDVSIIDLPNGLALAATSDPLSLIPSLGLRESAWLSVHLMANDMATTGFAPMYGQMVLNLPATFSKNDFKIYWDFIHQYCSEIGVAITGGHTGFIEQQNSTIAGGGTFFTVAEKSKILCSKNANVGDAILVTKQSAIIATSILALSFPETVKNKLGKEIYEEAAHLFYESSSLKDALIAVDNQENEITAMHDVTEGGLLGAIYELTVASNKGALIENDKLPIGHAQKAIGNLFEIDPRYCVGAGAMIITCKPNATQHVIKRLEQQKINCTLVGQIKHNSYGIKLLENQHETNLIHQKEDPYWGAFFKAMQKQWK